MKTKLILLLSLFLFLSGCATYKFQPGKPPYDKGYVVSREDYVICEYTIGKDNTVPADLELAKQRFKRRKDIVEHYYKQMGYIENRFKMAFVNPAVMFLKLIGGVFRLPGIAISDYRAAHNPKYRERIQQIEDEKDKQEEEGIKKLKGELGVYIQQDITREPDGTAQDKNKPIRLRVRKDMVNRALEQRATKRLRLPKAQTQEPLEQAEAVIMAKPSKGYSPLRVRFYGSKSYSRKGRIVSYLWDFGDGDTSTKANPVNTYWSGLVEPQFFTVTLTVTDDKGNTVKATTQIEVINK